MEKSNLYALLIGVNKYEGEVPELRSCDYDTRILSRFLKRYAAANGLAFHSQRLTNYEATFEAVIDSFSFFEAAKAGDLCIFYFTGHGSTIPAPKELIHLARDDRLQTIVCHDSRSTARDLTNKEISHLIWEVTTDEAGKDKGLHFLAIFDSCYSESVTRSPIQPPPREGLRPKLCPETERKVTFRELYQSQAYTGVGNARSPRVGKHISLSAAESDQKAYEKHFKGIPRSIFTKALVDVLSNKKLAHITYGQLIKYVQTSIQPEYPHLQWPVRQYAPSDLSRAERTLFGRQQHHISKFYAYFDQNGQQWKTNIGLLHLKSDQDASIKIVLPSGERVQANLLECSVGESVIQAAKLLNPEEIYPVDFKMSYERLLVGIESSPQTGSYESFLRRLCKVDAAAGQPVLLFADEQEPDYWIKIRKGHLIICPDQRKRPLFPAISIEELGTDGAISAFLDQARHLCQWLDRWNLSGSSESLQVADEFIIRFQVYKNFQSETEPGEATELDYTESLPVLSYQKREGGQKRPYFSFSIKRRIKSDENPQPLWVAVLFFNETYGIESDYWPVTKFKAKDSQEVKFFFEEGGQRKFNIPLEIDEEILKWKETVVKNMFKIIVSTAEIDTEPLTLPDLEVAKVTRSTEKGVSKNKRSIKPKQGWAVLDIPFLIQRQSEHQPP